MALLLMLSLIVLSVIFEKSKHHLEHHVDEHKHIILQALFGELTVLGFIALITFFLMQTGTFEHFSQRIYGDEQHLLHLFEKVHFGLFFVMLLFLLLIGWLIYVQDQAAQRWHSLDLRAASFIKTQRRLASPARAPKSRAGSLRALPVGHAAAGASAAEGYQPQVDEAEDAASSAEAHVRVSDPELWAFLQLRQRFTYGLSGAEGRKVRVEDPHDTFPLGAYLTRCSAGITASIVEVHPLTWFVVALSLLVVYLANAALSGLGMCLIFVLWGWLCAALLLWLSARLAWMNGQLRPRPDASLAAIAEGSEAAQPPYLSAPARKEVSKHEALYPLRLAHHGPHVARHTVQFVLLFCAVYLIGLEFVFGAEMVSVAGSLGWALLALSALSVVVAVAEVRRVIPLLVVTESVAQLKKIDVVAITMRECKLSRSLRLLKLLAVMHSNSVTARKRTGASSPEEVQAERAKALAALLPGQREELTDAFELYDVNNDGEIDRHEFSGLLRSMGQDLNPAEQDRLFSEMDTNGNGRVERDEFIAVMAPQLSARADAERERPPVEQLAEDLFREINKDEDGFVSFAEFRAKVRQLPTDMAEEEVDELLQEIFGSDDTFIDREEFTDFIKRHKDEIGPDAI